MNNRYSWVKGLKTAFLIVLFTILLSLGGKVCAETTKWKVIEADAAHLMLMKGEDVVFVNTMSQIECLDHGIPGSLCIPCPDFMERAPLLLKNKSQQLILYCESGECHRSLCAAEKALSLGFSNISIMKGGLPAWKEADYAIESEKRIPRVGISSIKPKALNKWLSGKKDVLILDIRSRDVFHEGHLPDAINIPIDKLPLSYPTLPLNKPILTVDEFGYSSFLASCYLYERGHRDIKRLFGGMRRWKAFEEKEHTTYGESTYK
ncbi:MAG: rhodanese-like domain-containing protein [Deltaproteobacteria bacterium]|nr:rhodanese-like domain-containing protein [Deltaproteobacteria bacterium]